MCTDLADAQDTTAPFYAFHMGHVNVLKLMFKLLPPFSQKPILTAEQKRHFNIPIVDQKDLAWHAMVFFFFPFSLCVCVLFVRLFIHSFIHSFVHSFISVNYVAKESCFM